MTPTTITIQAMATERLKWIKDEQTNGQRTQDGRFVIRRWHSDPKLWNYWGLTDMTTNQEYPCRTEASAKAAARARTNMNHS